MLQKQEYFGPILSHQEVNICLNLTYTLKDLPFGSKKLKQNRKTLSICFWNISPLTVYFFNFLVKPLKNGYHFTNIFIKMATILQIFLCHQVCITTRYLYTKFHINSLFQSKIKEGKGCPKF